MPNANYRTHPLLGRFDLDPGRWRPMFYPVEISVPVALGQSGTGSVNLNNQPFIFTKLTHQIVGPTADSQSGLVQDGMYDIEFKDQQSNYQKDPVMADQIAGSVIAGYQTDLPFPIPFAGNRTVTFRVTNRVLRVLVPEADYYTVALTMHGVADWGELVGKQV